MDSEAAPAARRCRYSKAFDSTPLRRRLRAKGIRASVPERQFQNRRRRGPKPKLHPASHRRYQVERLHAWLDNYRALAVRYERKAHISPRRGEATGLAGLRRPAHLHPRPAPLVSPILGLLAHVDPHGRRELFTWAANLSAMRLPMISDITMKA
ncbi:transposase [Calidithermus roseus]|uniref:transposase n=1 Tax=Calidithermus roseus TaxID=1644118 RepID=UPI0011C40B12